MKFRTIKQNLLRYLGNVFLHSIVSVLCKTVSVKRFNSNKIEELLQKKQNIVFAFWHGTMLMPWYVHRNQKFSALVSQSKDGSLLANSLTKWGYKVERGSSHKGGKEALNTLLQNIDENFSVSITPDGPTGPPRIMKAGAVVAAQRKSVPLVLCGVAYKKKYVFNSWDKFEIPKFFSEVILKYSDPIIVEENLSREEISEIIKKCDILLNQLQKDAEEIS